VTLAQLDQSYDLRPAAVSELEPGPPPRLAPEAVAHLDWHNSRVAFLTALEDAIDNAPDDRARERFRGLR